METKQNKGDILADRIEEMLGKGFFGPSNTRELGGLLADYRKPWTLGRSVNGHTLADGQEWHRQDWTEDMLPEGWRPKLRGERKHAGTELFHQNGHPSWYAYSESCDENESDRFYFFRTLRPLPAVSVLTPAQIADGWVEWHGGDCPVWGGSEIKVMYYGAGIHAGTAKAFYWKKDGDSSDIIAYRPDPMEAVKKAHAEGVAIQVRLSNSLEPFVDFSAPYPPDFASGEWEWRVKPEPVMVQLGPEDVPPGSVIRSRNVGMRKPWISVLNILSSGVEIVGNAVIHQTIPFSVLFINGWEINRSIPLAGQWDATAWEKCEKPEGSK